MGGDLISGGFRLVDAGAIVTGAAIASVHVRIALPDPHGLPAWSWGGLLFSWLTLASAGPFVYLSRRLANGFERGRYPRVGDHLWVIWGCPWIVSALIGSVPEASVTDPGRLDMAYVASLGIGLCLATMTAVPILAACWLWGGPTQVRSDVARRGNWTQWVGLGLTATWPLQCAVGLVLMG